MRFVIGFAAFTSILLAGGGFPALALPTAQEDSSACEGDDCEGDSGDKDDSDKPKTKIKDLDEFIEDKDRIDGLLPLYQDRETGVLFLELSAEQFGPEYIYYTFVHSGTAGLLGSLAGLRQAGDMKDNYLIRFRRRFNEVDVIRQNSEYLVDEGSPLERAIRTNNADSNMASLTIVAKSEDDSKFIVAVNGLLAGTDLFRFGEASPLLKTLGITPKLNKAKTNIVRTNNYPENTAILVEYTFDFSRGPAPATVLLQHNFTPVPDNDFVPRLDDQRIGFFTVRQTNIGTVEGRPYEDKIKRWDLEKSDPAAAVSPAKKPITFWIQNSTPLEYRETIRRAGLQWNIAFESAGISDAIRIETQPDDATWDAGDVRYNMIQWIASPNPSFNGYGPSVANPRTGEIIGANIVLEQNNIRRQLMLRQTFPGGTSGAEALHDGHVHHDGEHHFDEDCAIAEAMQANLGFAQTMLAAGIYAEGSDEAAALDKIVRQSLTYLVMHEIGHTLGLSHNMKASYYRTLEELAGGLSPDQPITGSVMDYPAVNILSNAPSAVPIYPHMPGPYDLWAIQFGYGSAMDDPATRTAHLAQAGSAGLNFGNDAEDMRSLGRGIDPRVIPYDMSSDPVGFASRQMDLIREAQTKLLERMLKPGGSYDELLQADALLRSLYGNHAKTISRYVGGIYVADSLVPAEGSVEAPLQPVSASDQKAAMAMLTRYLFAPDVMQPQLTYYPFMLADRRGQSRVRLPDVHTEAWKLQSVALDHLLHPATLERLTDAMQLGSQYSAGEMLTDLTAGVFDSPGSASENSIRRNLQLRFTRKIIDLYGSGSPSIQLVQPEIYGQLVAIRRDMNALRNRGDDATRAHRKFLVKLIDDALEADS